MAVGVTDHDPIEKQSKSVVACKIMGGEEGEGGGGELKS